MPVNNLSELGCNTVARTVYRDDWLLNSASERMMRRQQLIYQRCSAITTRIPGGIMKHLSLAKAAVLADLADKRYDESRRNHSGGVVSSKDLASLVLRDETEEARAFRLQVERLTKQEALDAVALMYVGRGDHLNGDFSPASVEKAFNGFLDLFSKDDHGILTDKLLEKTAVMHRYLAEGIARVRHAF